MNTENIINALIVLAVIAVVLRAVWPSMVANNVFSKKRIYNYNPSEDVIENRRFKLKDTLIFGFLANIAGTAVYIYRAIQINTDSASYYADDMRSHPAQFVILGFMCTLIPFIIMRMSEKGFALLRNLKYAMQVWLTVISVTPIVFLIVYAHQIMQQTVLVYMYFKLLMLGNGLGCFTFAALVLAANYYSNKPWKPFKKRNYILIATQAVMLINISGLAWATNYGWSWLTGWVIYAVTMTICMFYFRIDKTVYSTEIAELLD